MQTASITDGPAADGLAMRPEGEQSYFLGNYKSLLYLA